MIARLKEDTGKARMDRLDRRAATRIFSDWKIWYGVLMYMGEKMRDDERRWRGKLRG